MGILSWLIFGGLVGFVATSLMGVKKRHGLISNIIIGIVGAMLGGFVASEVFGYGGVGTWTLEGFVIALLGSIVLLGIINVLSK